MPHVGLGDSVTSSPTSKPENVTIRTNTQVKQTHHYLHACAQGMSERAHARVKFVFSALQTSFVLGSRHPVNTLRTIPFSLRAVTCHPWCLGAFQIFTPCVDAAAAAIEAGRFRSVRTPGGRMLASTFGLARVLQTTLGTNLTSEFMMVVAAVLNNSFSHRCVVTCLFCKSAAISLTKVMTFRTLSTLRPVCKYMLRKKDTSCRWKASLLVVPNAAFKSAFLVTNLALYMM